MTTINLASPDYPEILRLHRKYRERDNEPLWSVFVRIGQELERSGKKERCPACGHTELVYSRLVEPKCSDPWHAPARGSYAEGTYTSVVVRRMIGLIETANKNSAWEVEAAAEMKKAVNLLLPSPIRFETVTFKNRVQVNGAFFEPGTYQVMPATDLCADCPSRCANGGCSNCPHG